MKRLEATIFGYVQGVSFRYYTRSAARQFGVVGWVKNELDGSVRVVGEGSEAALKQLLTFLHDGSPAARVDRVDLRWGEPTNEFHTFGVRL